MIKKKFTRTIEFTAVQFDPKEPEWHHSVQRVTINGKIPDFESYHCIIPCDHVVSIKPGDWIIVDSMNNATGVLDQQMLKDKSLKIEETL
jgi:hypothetical protein